MKSIIKSGLLLLLIAALLNACRKNGGGPGENPSDAEYRFIRVLVADASSNQITQLTPVDGSTSVFEAAHPNAALYPVASRRFGALLFGTNNFVQFFDSGLEFHGDHADVKGTPKFAAITSDAPRPSHFKSRGSETLVFNDGDGTLSTAIESDFHVSGKKMDVINAGLEAHHGAMAQFDNGTYAVTVTDGGSSLAGPHGVKIIDKHGHELHPVSLPVSRLHGNATNGKIALFGVAGGVLVVDDNGAQRIIENPAGFGEIRLGTILEAPGAGKFVGFVATKGAYYVDPAANTITPILESTDIMQCKMDYAGKNLAILMLDGTLRIYDLSTGVLAKEAKVISATSAADALKPVLEASSRYAYISLPALGEVHQVKIADPAQVKKIKVSAQPSRMAILGFETDEGH